MWLRYVYVYIIIKRRYKAKDNKTYNEGYKSECFKV